MLIEGARAPFGQLLSAMVTPFDVAGGLDLETAQALATWLVDEQGHDGLVVNGTGGEAPTTTDTEKADLVRAVVEAVGDRASVVAGVGTNDTVHTVHLAQEAAKAGADALLVVTPYYNKPPQAGIAAHMTVVADSTDLPVMVYDIPGRSGVPIDPATLATLARHDRIVAIKDAKGDVSSSARVIAETGLAYYAGNDAEVLPWLSIGAVGLVGTATQLVGPDTEALFAAWDAGVPSEALRLHRKLWPILTGIFATQGAILAKAGLRLLGRDTGPVRLPLVDATEHEISHLRADMRAAGLDV
ncbi:4-hydroxy-tetrahydrodipicolinate synthase [Jatrophihabitans sp. YIM 134969]